ncbi:uncharacterized protein Dwil_GK21879 [Drosophila willistoni]|uniref:GK21879 n=1 Tax=Drosophila willistoni TaxID=7260 RepID=B4MQI2_DROWI|nr:uncharacterized protein LOC6640314 isoform X1 [Drosophila willistoni]EDW74371.1 uncharacterized protein Dwil_GK21879 [Drosophila willistoni]
MAPSVNTTATTSYYTINITDYKTSIVYNSSWETTTPFNDYPNEDYDAPFYYFYPTYGVYVFLVFLFIFLLPTALIISAMQRKKEANARALALQRQRARRQMEINVTNNNNCSGGGSGVSNMCPVIDEPNNITILPKTLDLPPSYDEAAFYPNKDQSLSGAASTLTILTSTNMESSNPSLAAAAGVVSPNEPPPVYEVGNTVTTTTSTTTTTMRVV